MKNHPCDGCGTEVQVENTYEQVQCCSGYLCGCYGTHINPIFCDACEEKQRLSLEDFIKRGKENTERFNKL